MGEVCKEMIRVFSLIFFGESRKEAKKKKNQKINYTLSSVFPTKAIMEEARKYL